MHIGVDATCWQNTRGYGRHARSLLSALVELDSENRYTLLTDSKDILNSMPSRAESRLINTRVPTTIAASANGHRSIQDMWQVSRALSDASFDLLLFPTNYTYVPVFSRAKKVVMVHDAIADHYPKLMFASWNARLAWKLKAGVGRWQASAIVTVSNYSREAILSRFRLSPNRVFVVGEASDPVFQVLHNPQPTPYLLSLGIPLDRRAIVYVGGFNPHKNLESLVAAFRKLRDQPKYKDVILVLVGETKKEVFHSYFGTIKRQIEANNLAGRAFFTGFIPDNDLVVLLNLSTVLVLPSMMEGFGLPAVEAAACGCPVIATAASPLPSLLGEGGLFINPNKPEDLQVTLARVLDSEILRRRMRAAGLEAVRELTWAGAAHQMMSVLRQVATL